MLIVVGPVEAEAHQRPRHPERPGRVGAVMEGVADLHLDSDLTVMPSLPAETAALERVHSPGYLDELWPVLWPGWRRPRPGHLRHR